MQYVILDLEWNSGYCRRTRGFMNEIIEFGAVKLDDDLHMIGQFSIFVRPEITKRLNRTVQELTQITNEDLRHGSTFTYAVSKFNKFVGDSVLMSWSTADLDTLETNCAYYYGSQRIPFLHRYVDVQEYFHSVYAPDETNRMALQNAAQELSVPMEDIPLHRAVGDSILTARVLQKIYDPEKLPAFIRPVDDAFYEKLNFHVTYLCRYDDPLIDKSQMYFLCPACQCPCRQDTAWKVRNKAFHADVSCPSCGTAYHGRIRFKRCYDGVSVSRRLLPVTQEEEEEQAPEC